MRFSRDVWLNKYGNANSNPHTKLQVYILSIGFVMGKIKKNMEFHQPLPQPTTLTTPLPIWQPQISMHIWRSRVSIDYI